MILRRLTLKLASKNGQVGPQVGLRILQPYALLEDMQKPVDLIILNSDEHVITNPQIRLAAQGGNLDWFRYWLQDYEDPDPAKKDRYQRWRKLRQLQEAQNNH